MSDLISRKALIEIISDNRFDISIKDKRKLIDSIRKQPTAYDVDDIAKKLKTDTEVWNDGLFEYIPLYQAIAIVKGAVKDE